MKKNCLFIDPEIMEKLCAMCEEQWPDDSEFFSNAESMCCIACAQEIRRKSPLNSIFTISSARLAKQINACRQARKQQQLSSQRGN